MVKYRLMLVAAITLGFCLPLAAQQAGGTKVGVLTCNTSASLGLLIGSHQKLRCSFKPEAGGPSNPHGGRSGSIAPSPRNSRLSRSPVARVGVEGAFTGNLTARIEYIFARTA